MSTPKGNNPDHPWVQPIVVAKTGHHQDTIRCAAQASVAVYFEPTTSTYPPSNFDAWLAGPFTKTVRRASMGQMSSLVMWANDNHVPYADAAVHDSAAIAFPPMRYEDMPREIARFQVHGTDFPWVPFDRHGDPTDTTEPTPPVSITVDASLTTGKAAAAAAHALWAWMLPHRPGATASLAESVLLMERWRAAGFPLTLDLIGARELLTEADNPAARAIIDAGLTEVAPDTLTAVHRPTGQAYWSGTNYCPT